ncbi:MAG: ABC transporter substrate-binding protein, partial [Alphaproteobacteria bacterium]|nr:ABC transporter substrate-binding protein [Alphaproteobacteria bacterium]
SNAQATEWTFKLRPGIKFHNDKEFNADDVVYSLRRIQDPKMDSPVRASIRMIEGIEAVDPMTVRMKLSEPFAELPLQLTDYRIMMIANGDDPAKTGNGTGPFKLEKFDPQGTSILVANTNYWEGAPGVARVEITGIPDAQARVQALLGGQIDMLQGITRQQRPLFERSGKHKLQEIPTGNWRGIVFRTDVKPFDDPRVRKAIRMAVDRKTLRDLVVGPEGGAIGCDTPVGPADQYRLDRTCQQDIAGAKALLAAAGYPNGLDFEVHVAAIEQVWPTMAEAFQQQVAAAGIRAKIVQVPTDGYWDQIWRKKDVSLTRWNDRPADAILNEAYRSGATWNETYLKDPKFDAILDAARRELDFNKRKALYTDAQNHLWENGGTYVAFHVTLLVGVTTRVKDLDAVENFMIRWHRVKVD